MNEWIKLSDVPKEVLDTQQEVVGFNPQWIDPDFNRQGIRICYCTDHGWQSAAYCSVHDVYEHRPAIGDEYDEGPDLGAPTHVHIIPMPVGPGIQVCDCTNCEYVDDIAGVCGRCKWEREE